MQLTLISNFKLYVNGDKRAGAGATNSKEMATAYHYAAVKK